MKKMTKFLKLSALVAFFVIVSQVVEAQVLYRLDTKSSLMVIKGTSTIHDWEMTVEQLKGSFALQSGDIFQSNLISGDMFVNVNSIKSEHSLMNKKTYDALKYDKFPQIQAKIISAEQKENIGNVKLELSIAGKTKVIQEEVRLKDLGNGKVEIKGMVDIKMTDYNVEPPVALMGTIKTGDKITIEYDLLFDKQGQLFGETSKSINE